MQQAADKHQGPWSYGLKLERNQLKIYKVILDGPQLPRLWQYFALVCVSTGGLQHPVVTVEAGHTAWSEAFFC